MWTFVICPHGWEKLDDLHSHLNSIHNIQLTTEAKTDGHIPFLNVDIYRRPDSSLEHSVQEVNPCQSVSIGHISAPSGQ
jgi:hypothetical protein